MSTTQRCSPMDIEHLVTKPQSSSEEIEQGNRISIDKRATYSRPAMPPQCPRGGNYSQHATILLVGIRGAGKKTLGRFAAGALRRKFIDLDEHVVQTSRTRFHLPNVGLEQTGYQNEVRHIDAARYCQALMQLLAQHPRHTIISCGNQIIGSSECRAFLPSARSMHPIICIVRGKAPTRRFSGEPIAMEDRWQASTNTTAADKEKEEHNELFFIHCSSHCFYNINIFDKEVKDCLPVENDGLSPSHPSKYKPAVDSFRRLIRQIIGETPLQDQGSSIFPNSWPSIWTRQVTRSSELVCDSPSEASLTDISTCNRQRILSCETSIQSLNENHSFPQRRRPRSDSANFSLPRKIFARPCEGVFPRRANILSRSSLLTRRTNTLSLTFPDLLQVQASLIREMTRGVDALELRADMLACLEPLTRKAREGRLLEAPNYSIQKVMEQIEALRRLAPEIPIVFTLRSTREGGFFFDDRNLSAHQTASPHSQAIYFRLIETAVATGVELVDIELGWDPQMTRRLIDARCQTKIVMSYHDLTGALKWDTMLPHQLYERACMFGPGIHIVLIMSTATIKSLGQNAHLASTLTKVNSDAMKDPTHRLPPLMAVNMGDPGRATRAINDIFNFVTHPYMTVKAGLGQMSLVSLTDLLVRLCIIPSRRYHIQQIDQSTELAKNAISSAFDEYGLPAELRQYEVCHLSLESYLNANQSNELEHREGIARTSQWSSDGLFLPTACLQQRTLYNLLVARGQRALTWSAHVTGRVDLLAREDQTSCILGTEAAIGPPGAFSELRGSLIGCHTLPAAIYRVLREYMAPSHLSIGCRSALLVATEDCGGDEEARETSDASKRAAYFALAKLGFRDVYICENSSHSRGDVSGDGLDWFLEVSDLIKHSPCDVLESGYAVREEKTSCNSSLHLDARLQNVFKSEKPHPFIGPCGKNWTEGQGEQPCGKIHDNFLPPSAIVLVGGQYKDQQRDLRALYEAYPSRFHTTTDKTAETTILHLPSRRSMPFGVSERDFTPSSVQHECACGICDEMVFERGSCVYIDACAIDRSRVQDGTFEAWTRRTAPIENMRKIWNKEG